jgi:hypothetical protein
VDGFFSNFWAQVTGGLVVAAIGALLAWIDWPRIKRWVAARDLPPVEDTHFTVLVAELEHDDKRQQLKP